VSLEFRRISGRKKYTFDSPVLILKNYLNSLFSFLGYIGNGFSTFFLVTNNLVMLVSPSKILTVK